MGYNKEWFIFIEDTDRKMFAVSGPVQANLVDDWLAVVVREQQAGRDIRCHDITMQQVAEHTAFAMSRGFSKVESGELIRTPKDRSKDYLGKLPAYASKADRAKIVQILCKGKCCANRWAELDKPYPGAEILRKAEMREYEATCLRCGSTASDNYNWFR